jgi:hypothetical protein
MHTAMGIGLAGGPLFVGAAAPRGLWLLFPLASLAACLVLLLATLEVALPGVSAHRALAADGRAPVGALRFWLFAGLALLYGLVVHRRGLARAVGSEHAEALSARHLEVEAGHRNHVAVALDEAAAAEGVLAGRGRKRHEPFILRQADAGETCAGSTPHVRPSLFRRRRRPHQSWTVPSSFRLTGR